MIFAVVISIMIKYDVEGEKQLPFSISKILSKLDFVDDSDETLMKDILKYIDVLVDGPYIESMRDLSLPFRGSTNQRIINLQDVNNK